MTARLNATAKELRALPPGVIADQALALKERLEALKGELIRRGLRTAEGEEGRVALSPPGEQDRTERAVLLQFLGIGEADFVARFTRKVKTDWQMRVSARRRFRSAA